MWPKESLFDRARVRPNSRHCSRRGNRLGNKDHVMIRIAVETIPQMWMCARCTRNQGRPKCDLGSRAIAWALGDEEWAHLNAQWMWMTKLMTPPYTSPFLPRESLRHVLRFVQEGVAVWLMAVTVSLSWFGEVPEVHVVSSDSDDGGTVECNDVDTRPMEWETEGGQVDTVCSGEGALHCGYDLRPPPKSGCYAD